MREIGSDRGPEERGTAMGRGRKENARGRGGEESRMFKRQMGRRESESTGSARRLTRLRDRVEVLI